MTRAAVPALAAVCPCCCCCCWSCSREGLLSRSLFPLLLLLLLVYHHSAQASPLLVSHGAALNVGSSKVEALHARPHLLLLLFCWWGAEVIRPACTRRGICCCCCHMYSRLPRADVAAVVAAAGCVGVCVVLPGACEAAVQC